MTYSQHPFDRFLERLIDILSIVVALCIASVGGLFLVNWDFSIPLVIGALSVGVIILAHWMRKNGFTIQRGP